MIPKMSNVQLAIPRTRPTTIAELEDADEPPEGSVVEEEEDEVVEVRTAELGAVVSEVVEIETVELTRCGMYVQHWTVTLTVIIDPICW
jgi:hypothetical protein